MLLPLCLDCTCLQLNLQLLDFTDTYSIQALHTPGHTMESVVWMVIDKSEGNRPLHVSSAHTHVIVYGVYI